MFSDRRIERGRVVDGGDAMLETQLGRQACQRGSAASGEARTQAALYGSAGDQLTGVSGGAVEKEVRDDCLP